MKQFNRVSVVGLGYIGLPTAAVLASRKIEVVGIDVEQRVVDTINNGDVHIVEPDLDIVVRAAVTQGYLRASREPEPAEAFLIAVPTPFTNDHEPDLSYIESATRAIAKVIEPGNLIILESTSPVGATEQLSAWLAEERPDLRLPQDHPEAPDVHIAHCPERVLPGHVLTELIANDRVIGGMTPACCDAAVELYRCFVEGEMLITNARTAEMCKLVENSFRDVNIAFANELSVICEQSDINVWELINLANHHPRVNILQPGTGVGGHCIAVDPWFIVSQAQGAARLIRTAREVNDYKPEWVAAKIFEQAESQRTRHIVCLGLAFKPNIDDLRESPALTVVELLREKGCELTVVEPNIESLPDNLEQGMVFAEFDQALQIEGAVFAVLVAHSEFVGNEQLSSRQALDFSGALKTD